MSTQTTKTNSNTTRYALIAVLVIAAFFGAFKFAAAKNAVAAAQIGLAPASGLAQAGGTGGTAGGAAGGGGGCGMSGGAAGGAGGGCCGGGGSSTPVEGAAKVESGVQKISVDVTRGYNPNVIKLKAGVPAEITFGQGAGCTQYVESQDLGFSEDLGSGPKTVKLQGLKAGTYGFACGMNMVTGTIVVE